MIFICPDYLTLIDYCDVLAKGLTLRCEVVVFSVKKKAIISGAIHVRERAYTIALTNDQNVTRLQCTGFSLYYSGIIAWTQCFTPVRQSKAAAAEKRPSGM